MSEHEDSAAIAQTGERLPRKQEVACSIPARGSRPAFTSSWSVDGQSLYLTDEAADDHVIVVKFAADLRGLSQYDKKVLLLSMIDDDGAIAAASARLAAFEGDRP